MMEDASAVPCLAGVCPRTKLSKPELPKPYIPPFSHRHHHPLPILTTAFIQISSRQTGSTRTARGHSASRTEAICAAAANPHASWGKASIQNGPHGSPQHRANAFPAAGWGRSAGAGETWPSRHHRRSARLSLARPGNGFAIVGSSGCALKRGASAHDRRPALQIKKQEDSVDNTFVGPSVMIARGRIPRILGTGCSKCLSAAASLRGFGDGNLQLPKVSEVSGRCRPREHGGICPYLLPPTSSKDLEVLFM